MRSVLGRRRRLPTSQIPRWYCAATVKPKSFKSLKNAAVEIHKQLIHQTKKWPVETGREDRSLKHDLVPRLETQLVELNESTDAKQVLDLGQQAQSELSAITELMANKHFKKVCVTLRSEPLVG